MFTQDGHQFDPQLARGEKKGSLARLKMENLIFFIFKNCKSAFG